MREARPSGIRLPLFTPYTQLPERLPPRVWTALRWCSVGCALGLSATAWLDPPLGMWLFWGLFVPALPLLFLLAPGTWRNVCPIVALNQIPRTLGFTRGLAIPRRLEQFAPLVSAGLFVAIVPLRKVLLEQSGPALAVFLLSVLALAFVGGMLLKGKSGWCSQFCPMLQVERFYGQSPIALIRNSHCRPCVGCTVNCYDFNPTAAYLADLHDENPRLAANRKLFAGAMPWLIVAFFTQPPLASPTFLDVVALYGRTLFFVAAGIGTFFVVDSITRESSQRVVLAHVVVAINLFYFFVALLVLQPFGVEPVLAALLVQVPIGLVSLIWFRYAVPVERQFLTTVGSQPRVASSVLRVVNADRPEKVEVDFESGPTVLATPGEVLLVVAEVNKVPIESGCRIGMCGADPVRVVSGGENLSPMTIAEQGTLERLGLSAECRLACVARVHGPVAISTNPTAVPAPEPSPVATAADETLCGVGAVDEGRLQLVVVGSGVSGITAALEARKRRPGCEVTIVGSEPYDFYNRMMIGKLVSESISIDKLYMMPRTWSEDRGVRFLLGVAASRIDRTERQVVLDDGMRVPYDRLILATGARSVVPQIEGFGMEGTFVLRTIDDGVQIQQYIRRWRCRTAVIIGGGLLGLEAAHYVAQIGVRAAVLDRNAWPLSRQLDRPAGTLLAEMMGDLGIDVILQAQAGRIIGSERISQVELADGRVLAADICVAAIGIEPEVRLAREAGLVVERGLVVDDRMETSDPAILAAGDVVEHRGRLYGLWPASIQQAEVAAANACGGDLRFEGTVPPARLKVAAIDLLSVGEIRPVEDGGREICIEETAERRYRRLFLRGGRVRGAILLGYPELAELASDAVAAGRDVSAVVAQLERGDWSVLAGQG